MIRIGRVSRINYEAGTAEITYPDRDNMVTQEIPFLSHEYNMPDIGDMVLVAHLEKRVEDGVIIGKFFTDGNEPIEYGPNIYVKEFDKDKCYLTYNKQTQEFKVHIKKENEYKEISIEEVIELKEEVRQLREEVTTLKEEVAKLKEKDANFEERISALEGGGP